MSIQTTEAAFIGARYLTRPPELADPDWTISQDTRDISIIQEELMNGLSDLIIRGKQNNKTQFQRLHPWACVLYTNMLVAHCAGRDGAHRINAILAGGGKTSSDYGISQEDVRIAQSQAVSEANGTTERQLWDCLSAVLAHDLPKDDAYRRFVAMWQQAQLHVYFHRMLQEAQGSPRGSLALKIRQNTRHGRGVGLQTQVIDYLAQQLDRNREFVPNILKQHQSMTVLVQHFSGGILLLVDEKSLRNM